MWTVILKDENGKTIKILDREFTINNSCLNKYKLLKYLDLYGDTIFNHIQMIDLVDDLEKLQFIEPENDVIREIIALTKICSKVPHQYLYFCGD